MTAAEWIFWISSGLVLYAYALYPLLLAGACRVWRAWRRRNAEHAETISDGASAASDWPTVSLLVPAFNEQPRLQAKLRNLGEMDYPDNRIEVVFVSDGSTDGTDGVLGAIERPRFRFYRLDRRQGKPSAINRAAAAARGEILVFSDAATLFAPDAVRRLARHFSDPRVGAVCGPLEFARSAESAATEGVYWRYETALRRMEGELNATLTASGAIYAVRRAAFRPLAPDTILEDFLVPMTARRLGYRVLYDPSARATDTAPETVRGEFARWVRLAAGSFRALGALVRGASTNPAVFWAFLSHKLLRWLAPLFLVTMAISSVALASRPFYGFALASQAAFYLWALAGMVFRDRLAKIRFALVGYFLVAMNLAFLVGLGRSITGRQPVAWTRVDA